MLLGPDLLFGGIRSLSARYLTPAWLGLLLALAWALGRRGALRTALLAAVLAVALLSSLHDVRLRAPWTKGTSVLLPEIAERIEWEQHPLILGDIERHHPGDLLARARLVPPRTRFQLLTIEAEASYALPSDPGTVLLFSPNPLFRAYLERRTGRRCSKLLGDLHNELWLLEESPR